MTHQLSDRPAASTIPPRLTSAVQRLPAGTHGHDLVASDTATYLNGRHIIKVGVDSAAPRWTLHAWNPQPSACDWRRLGRPSATRSSITLRRPGVEPPHSCGRTRSCRKRNHARARVKLDLGLHTNFIAFAHRAEQQPPCSIRHGTPLSARVGITQIHKNAATCNQGVGVIWNPTGSTTSGGTGRTPS